MDRDSTITKPEAKARWQSRGWQISRNIFLTGAFYVGNGWVAGGTGWFCWWLASGSFPHSLSTSFCAVYHWKKWIFLLLWSWHLYILVGGFNPSEKYDSQLGLLFPIYGNKYSKPPTSIYIYIITLGSRHGNVWNEWFITTSAGYCQWYWSWKTALWGCEGVVSTVGCLSGRQSPGRLQNWKKPGKGTMALQNGTPFKGPRLEATIVSLPCAEEGRCRGCNTKTVQPS